MKCLGYSDKGPFREDNEDSFGFRQAGSTLFAAIADGLGGEACGDIASRMAVESALDNLESTWEPRLSGDDMKNYLSRIFNNVNGKILRDCIDHRERIGMCTTLTLAIASGSGLYIAHIGDTRAYLVTDDGIRRLTEDHNLAAQYVKEGLLSEDEAKRHPSRNQLAKVVGINSYLTPDVFEYKISEGDTLVMCTDGFYAYLTNDDIATVKDIADERGLRALVEKAIANGSHDNSTVLAAKII